MFGTKQCSGCSKFKTLDSFGKNKRTKDGLNVYCKICHRAKTQEWRAANLEKARELGRKNKADQRKRDGEEVTRKKWREWYAKNAEHRRAYEREHRDPIKAKAQLEAWKAVQDGRLTRPNKCSKCGKRCRPDGHHTDYSKPLVVIWLCRSCHRKEQG